MSDPTGAKKRPWIDDHEALQLFSNDMYIKLRENAHKAHWNTVTTEWLLNRCIEELEELKEAVTNEDPGEIVREAADVANFAMMIADNARNFNG
jgi:NTP pyrophosphatase (non-canonical NTP hydrolase)